MLGTVDCGCEEGPVEGGSGWREDELEAPTEGSRARCWNGIRVLERDNSSSRRWFAIKRARVSAEEATEPTVLGDDKEESDVDRGKSRSEATDDDLRDPETDLDAEPDR